MKITDIRATPVAVPLRKADTKSKMRKGPNAVIAVIVEVYTDEGITGIGETPAVLGLDLSAAIVNSAKPILSGRDPSDINVLMKRLYVMYNANHLHIHAALHDQYRLVVLEKIVRGGLPSHLLEVPQAQAAGEFLFLRLFIAQPVQPLEFLFV